MATLKQGLLFPDAAMEPRVSDASSSTFVKNLGLPVHRWFRYSAGFSAEWVERVIRQSLADGPVQVFDPFAGSGTTLIAAEQVGIASFGIDAHPFVSRVARAKLQWRSDPIVYRKKVAELQSLAGTFPSSLDDYPPLIGNCYENGTLAALDQLRQAWMAIRDNTPASELAWLTLIAILRKCSSAGTAQWQYILPKKRKRAPQPALYAFEEASQMFFEDMQHGQALMGPRAQFAQSDARTCAGVPDDYANLVVTSPPYPNNYDYADSTRLEMSFFREISGWGDLQQSVRQYLVRSCSQHVPERAIDLQEVLASPEVMPIREELGEVCGRLSEVRKTKGGKKTYHLMVACYFHDLAQVWKSLRRVCRPGAKVCFVIGDSAPYGVYVPVMPWLERLALAAGFKNPRYETTRPRNVKWKNRKHRVPLQEGRLWMEG